MAARAELTHVVYSRDAQGQARISVNGKQVAIQQVAGSLDNWGDDFRLTLANELTGDRPWAGELHLVAVYSRALSDAEIARNFEAKVPTAGELRGLLPPASPRQIDFVKNVQPILRKRCFECHAAGNEEGGVNLGVRQRVFEGGNHGPVLAAGDSENSRLIHLVAAFDKQDVMPPEGQPLSHEEIGILRRLDRPGHKWPDGADVADPRAEQAKRHWAFQPLRPVATAIKNPHWCRSPIDRFILAQLERAGLRPQNRSECPTTDSPDCVQSGRLTSPPRDEVRDFTAAAERDPEEHRKSWSIGFLTVRTTASIGVGIGSTSPATRIAMDRKATATGRRRIITATSSSALSMTISLLISSFAGSSPGMSTSLAMPRPSRRPVF